MEKFTIKDLEKLAAEQEKGYAAVEVVRRRFEAESKRIRSDSELTPTQVKKRIAKLSESANAEVLTIVQGLMKTAERVNGQGRNFTKDALMRRAKFSPNEASDAAIRTATLIELQRVPTQALVDRLEDAVESGNAAMVNAVLSEASSRPSSERSAIAPQLAHAMEKVDIVEVGLAKRYLGRVKGFAELAKLRWAELATPGRKSPAALLNAARQAGITNDEERKKL